MDLFQFYRNLLFVMMTIYGLLTTAASLWQFSWLLTSDDRAAAIMRNYVAVMVLRLRVARFRWEIIQIAALSAALIGLGWVHIQPDHLTGLPWSQP